MRPPRNLAILLGGAIAWLALGCGRESVEPRLEEVEPVEIQASVDRAVATTGDLITYQIRVERSPDYEIEIPEPGAEIAGFRITDTRRESSELRSGRAVDERIYELRADLVGSYVLPPVAVGYRPLEDGESDSPAPWEIVATSEIFVEVESVLPSDGEATDIRGLKPLERRKRQIPWLWIGVGAAVVALGLGLIVWLVRRRKGPDEVVVPPHELAFSNLDALRATDFDDLEAVRRFYFSISEIIRFYVEGRFELNATDLTTEEIVVELPELTDLGPSENEQLSRFLKSTDRVKFANHEPLQPEIEQTYEEALTFVEATKPVDTEENEATPGEEVAA
jgi:hypothetical protein